MSVFTTLCSNLTNRVVAQLQLGTIPWLAPWTAADHLDPMLPYNARTGHVYSGLNTLILWDSAVRAGYTSARWVGLQQMDAIGGRLAKRPDFVAPPGQPWATGQRPTEIVHMITRFTTDARGRRTTQQQPRVLRVFNLDQFDPASYDPNRLTARDRRDPALAACDVRAIADTMGLAGGLHYGASMDCYLPGADLITMPVVFETHDDHDAALLHQLIHATAQRDRMDRPGPAAGDPAARAREALIAELGAAFLCARLGVPAQCRHTTDIPSWIAQLRRDPRLLYHLATEARHAADWLLAQQPAPARAAVAA